AASDDLAGGREGDVLVPERTDVLLEVVDRILRQQHLDVTTDVALQQLRIEVVAVPVRDVQEVRLAAELLPVQTPVVGEREPGAVEGRPQHRVADDVSADGLDEHSGVAESGDP